MDRKAELERKKAKLAMLREEKDRRRREKEQKDMEEAATRGGSAPSGENRRDLDEMLSSLGVAPVSEVLSSLSSVNSATPDNSATQTPDGSLIPANSAGPAYVATSKLLIVLYQDNNQFAIIFLLFLSRGL